MDWSPDHAPAFLLGIKFVLITTLPHPNPELVLQRIYEACESESFLSSAASTIRDDLRGDVNSIDWPSPRNHAAELFRSPSRTCFSSSRPILCR